MASELRTSLDAFRVLFLFGTLGLNAAAAHGAETTRPQRTRGWASEAKKLARGENA
jgi:hypothetical protein